MLPRGEKLQPLVDRPVGRWRDQLRPRLFRVGLHGEGGADESLARIQEIWIVARPDVETTAPELANGIGATVDMAATAVERTRPADADKAGLEEMALADANVQKFIDDKTVRKVIVVPGKLVGLVVR